MIGGIGGSAAIYRAVSALGLVPAVARGEFRSLDRFAPPDARTIVILGAGIGGLVAAYELKRAGHRVTVLEASERIGGRNLTVRAGDRIDELGNRQICKFDDHPNLYFNCGPARIPANHWRVLHYCRELGVELEIFVNENRNAWVQDEHAFNGKPVRNRHYVTDARGFLAELTSKYVLDEPLDQQIDGVDAERLLEFLRSFGDLDPDSVYRGSTRAGTVSGGMVVPAVGRGVLDIGEIVNASFWRRGMHFGESEDQAAPMMQPVGGMDRIVAAFRRELDGLVTTNARVRSVRLREDGVNVEYVRDGRTHEVRADYCLNNIPSHLLTGVENNFPSDYAKALAAIPRGRLFKIGLQAKRRFWEDEAIYGGISWTSQDITQIWYPSHGIFTKKGIILGAYTFGDEGGTRFGRLPHTERIEIAIRRGERIHPNYREHIETGVSVAWHRMNHMLGCAARWDDDLKARFFSRLQKPVGRHYLIGDQTSFHPGWQEGAIASSHHALEHLNHRMHTDSKPV
jgi:monoamine oxidase